MIYVCKTPMLPVSFAFNAAVTRRHNHTPRGRVSDTPQVDKKQPPERIKVESGFRV